MKIIFYIALVLLVLGISGQTPALTPCPDPRPSIKLICPTNLSVVCGYANSRIKRTYDSSCEACKYSWVAWTTEGPCPVGL